MNFEGISKTADRNMANLKTWADSEASSHIETCDCTPKTWILKWKHNECGNTNNNCDRKQTCLVSIERFQGQFLLSISLPGFYTFLSLPQKSLNILILHPRVSIFDRITMLSSVLVRKQISFREGKCKENCLPAFTFSQSTMSLVEYKLCIMW